jgi:hypothetical protein
MAKRVGTDIKTIANHKERIKGSRKLSQALCQICREGFQIGDVGIELDGNGNFHRTCVQDVLLESFAIIPQKIYERPGTTVEDLWEYYRNVLIDKGYTDASSEDEQAV